MELSFDFLFHSQQFHKNKVLHLDKPQYVNGLQNQLIPQLVSINFFVKLTLILIIIKMTCV